MYRCRPWFITVVVYRSCCFPLPSPLSPVTVAVDAHRCGPWLPLSFTVATAFGYHHRCLLLPLPLPLTVIVVVCLYRCRLLMPLSVTVTIVPRLFYRCRLLPLTLCFLPVPLPFTIAVHGYRCCLPLSLFLFPLPFPLSFVTVAVHRYRCGFSRTVAVYRCRLLPLPLPFAVTVVVHSRTVAFYSRPWVTVVVYRHYCFPLPSPLSFVTAAVGVYRLSSVWLPLSFTVVYHRRCRLRLWFVASYRCICRCGRWTCPRARAASSE